jgi:glycosyltransferase involved in cell wall biosynthesis
VTVEALEIAHVVRGDTFAGVERYVCAVANALSARGHHVRVVGGDPRMRCDLHEEVRYAAAASTFEVFTTLRFGSRPGLVHAHMTAAEAAAVAALPRHGTPIVSTRHFPDRRGRRIPKVLARLIRDRLAEQVAISRFVGRGIGEPCVLIHNGVAERAAAALEEPRVLMMQRLDSEKDPKVGIRAWARSGLAQRGWHLTVAGEGRLADALRSLAQRLGVLRSVSFLGWTADTDALLEESSIFLAPPPAEPFGLAVVEAMAHGVPVVAANGGAHPETVGPDGFLFPPGDVEAASERLVALAENSTLGRREGERLRRRQQEFFSLDRHVDALEELYLSVLRRSQ